MPSDGHSSGRCKRVPIFKRGNVYWARWTENGEKKRKSLGTKDPREAQRIFEELTKQGSLTVGEILTRWLKYKRARCKPRSVDLYEIVRRRFTAVWGDLTPSQLTTTLVEDFQERALEVGLNPSTINHQTGIALSALQWAHDRGLAEAEPPKWKRLKVHGGRARKYLTASEIKRLRSTVQEPRWERLEVFVMLSLFAGLRQQEIAWLTWEDVDLEDGWLHVRPKRGWSPKSATSERSVPIARELEGFLRKLARSGKWVAAQSPGKQWCRRHLGNECRRLFKAADVDDGGPHTLHRLRGTFATRVLRSGGDLESLRELLGHSVLSITAGYLQATSDSKRRAVAGLGFESE